MLDALRRLGMTEYAARCYVALVSMPGAEASAVADAAEVPRTKVYAALKDLVDARWVVAEGGRPVTYRAVAPEERMAEAEKEFLEETDAAMMELQARFASPGETIPVTAYQLRGRAATSAKALELVGRARDELLVNVGFLAQGDARPLAEAIEKARRRGVRVRVLLAPGLPDAREFRAMGARVPAFPFLGVMVDLRQALVVMPGPSGEPVGLWNPTPAFVEMVQPLLVRTWEDAAPAE